MAVTTTLLAVVELITVRHTYRKCREINRAVISWLSDGKIQFIPENSSTS
jgi:hypothetical protein